MPTGASSQGHGYFGRVYADECSQGVFQGGKDEHLPPVWSNVVMLQWCWDSGQLCGDHDYVYAAAWVVFVFGFCFCLCPCWDVLLEESRESNVWNFVTVSSWEMAKGCIQQPGLQNSHSQWCSVPLFKGLNCGTKLKKKN